MSSRKIIKSKLFFENEIIEKLAEVSTDKIVQWPNNDQLTYVGKPISRVDGTTKVKGTAKYTFDMHFQNMAHAKILRSPFPHAKIISIDTTKAKNLPGVLSVISNKNSEKISWFKKSYLFDSHLRYQGDEVACVVAETEALAVKALSLIDVKYEKLPFVIDAEIAFKSDSPKLFPDGNIRKGKPDEYERGDIQKGFNAADFVIEETYKTPTAVHNPAEPHCSVVKWDGEKLIVYDSTQAVFRVRDQIAEALKIETDQVRVIKDYMGGAFGSKLAAGKYTVMAALLSKELKRPVKIVLDRKEMNLAVGNRPDSTQKLKLGIKKDGTLTALSHYSIGTSGAFSSNAGCSWPLRTIYKCANVESKEYSLYINAGPGRPFRAPGHVQGVFALDSIIDKAAEKILMDPLDLRLKNYATSDQVFNLPYTSKKLREAYLQGAEKIGWKNRNKTAGSGNGTVKKGIGMASQIWWGGGGPPAFANLELNQRGQLHIYAGTQDLGTGTYTILAQVAAEVLDIPLNKIEVHIGDTEKTPYCPGSGGSVTAPSVSPAVRDAAEQLKSKLTTAAAAILEDDPKNLAYKAGIYSSKKFPDKTVSLSEIVQQSHDRSFSASGAREANPEEYMINSFGAQFAEVEVDTLTGKVVVKRIVAAHDIGRTLNTKLLTNQIHGGIMQGIGFALYEERVINKETGKVVTVNLTDYKMPTIRETPQIDVIIVSENDPMISNTGVKGVGEPPIIPTAGSIANAVYNAIGVQIKELPITPDKILNALYN